MRNNVWKYLFLCSVRGSIKRDVNVINKLGTYIIKVKNHITQVKVYQIQILEENWVGWRCATVLWVYLLQRIYQYI